MRTPARLGLVALFAGAVPVVSATPCIAAGAGENTARVLVEAGDDAATFCVSFEEPSISGIDLLRRTGLPVVVEDHGAGQVTVCRIGSVGCSTADQPCFCECDDLGACTYWGYFRGDVGGWQFSEVGPADTVVRDGDAQAWRYAVQSADGSAVPRATPGVCVESVGDAEFLAGKEVPRGSGSPLRLASILLAFGAVLALMVVRARKQTGGEA